MPLFEYMKRIVILVNLFILLGIWTVQVEAQAVDRKLLSWQQKIIDIGPVLEENGPIITEFLGRNLTSSPIHITDVISDCGCTTVEYTKDTLGHYMIASVQVAYDPANRGGNFSKSVIVRTSADEFGDTLYIEGFNLPVPEEKELAYNHKVGNIGFRLPVVNMGNVFTNEAKVKYVEIYNFGDDDFILHEEQTKIPEYLKANLLQDTLAPNTRGLLAITYDGLQKNDLGFFEETVSLQVGQNEDPFNFKLISVVYEYFPPLPKSMEEHVAKLGVSDSEINLGNINSGSKVSRSFTLNNQGPEPLEIRKIGTNCDCLQVDFDTKTLRPEDSVKLNFTFDPKGRKGIDHKHITIFSNDPLNPVRTVVIRSSIN